MAFPPRPVDDLAPDLIPDLAVVANHFILDRCLGPDETWRAESACADLDPTHFFAETSEMDDEIEVAIIEITWEPAAEVAALCGRCPVNAQCQAAELETPIADMFGYRASKTAVSRQFDAERIHAALGTSPRRAAAGVDIDPSWDPIFGRIATLPRRIQIACLRGAGWTNETIADHFDMTRRSVQRDLSRAAVEYAHLLPSLGVGEARRFLGLTLDAVRVLTTTTP